MHLPCVIHGEVGGTKEVYDPGLGIESLSGSPSTVTIWKRLLCGCHGCWAGDAGGAWSRVTSFKVEGGEECVPLLLRVGACADELRLMGGEHGSCLAGAAAGVEASASLARKVSSACARPLWSGCGEGPAERARTAQLKNERIRSITMKPRLKTKSQNLYVILPVFLTLALFISKLPVHVPTHSAL
jgi:hypothetical protein